MKGGAVQTLTNFLMDENELQQKFAFDVFSPRNRQAHIKATEYRHSNVHFCFDAGIIRFATNVAFKLRLPVDLGHVMMPHKVKRYLQTAQYDAVFVNGYVRGLPTVLELVNGRAPVFMEHHVVTDIINEKSIDGKMIFEKCEKLAFVSQYACEKANTDNLCWNSKIVCFTNAINLAEYKNISQNRESIRHELRLSESDVVFVFVGRFVAQKGVYELIRAFVKANQRYSNIKLLVIGGNTYSGKKIAPYMNQCHEAAKISGESIHFLGSIPKEEVPHYLGVSDVGCIPSICEEACGLTGIEYMAAGLPVLTTDAGGIKEYIPLEAKLVAEWTKDCDTNRLVDLLEAQIIRYATDKELREEKGEYGREFSERYGLQKYYSNFLSFLEMD